MATTQNAQTANATQAANVAAFGPQNTDPNAPIQPSAANPQSQQAFNTALANGTVGQPPAGQLVSNMMSGADTLQSQSTNAAQTSSASSGFAPGWQASSLGAGWAYNPSTGQNIPTNNPTYQAQMPASANTTNPNTGTPAASTPSWNSPSTANPISTADSTSSAAVPYPITPTSQSPISSTVPTNPDGTTVSASTSTAAPIAPPPQVQNTIDPATQALISQLQNRANESTLIDPNDPTIKAQTDAFAAQQDRAARNYDAQQAEKSGPYATGANQTTQRMMAETAGQNTAAYQGSLMQNELTARRNEIQSALTSLSGVLTAQQQNDLQAKLANLNAALTNTQQNAQQQQFYSSLNQNDKQFVTQLTQNERFKNMDDALSRYTLAQQNAQFAASLAQQGNIADMQHQFQEDQLTAQQQDTLTQLAQSGQYQQFQEQYLQMKMASDSNNFLAGLAQQGNIAQMQDIFNKMQLAQQGVEFGASLGQGESQFLDTLGNNISNTQQNTAAAQQGLA